MERQDNNKLITDNNKRIAKNTLILYIRMLFLMIVGLYTSRVVLNALGIENFGLYNVVGGLVAMFSILSGSLSAAISRFVAYELGTKNKEKLSNIFSSAVNIQLGLVIIVIIIAETAGLWFLNVKMNIPDSRMMACNWVFQLTILTFAINLISIPYNAIIIAHEKMSAFAYISIIDGVGKLMIAYFISLSSCDKLIFYALLMFVLAFIIRVTYGIYCKHKFEECTYRLVLDKDVLKQMSGFAGWNFIGASSAVLRDQGGNIVINLFCGPAVNAARAIAFQVHGAIHAFASNFMTALNPQITKSYASGDKTYMMLLIFQGARFSFYMLLLLSLPLIVNTRYILELWLDIVPEHTVLFVQLTLLFSMSESISNPLITAMLATGKIRNYQIVVGGLQMLNLPVSYILLRIGCFPESILIVAIIISQCCFAVRLIMLRRMIGISVKEYLLKVYSNVFTVAIVSSLLPLIFACMLEATFLCFLLLTLISLSSTILAIFYIGCTDKERSFVIQKAKYITTVGKLRC